MGELDPSYTSLCSSLTLQTDKRGFFLPYADTVTETVGSSWLEKNFAKLKTDEERIKICYTNKKLTDAVHEPLDRLQQLYRMKSASVAEQKRREGLLELELGRPQAALTLLSQSVMRAPPKGVDKFIDGGLTLALGLVARAEALMELKEFDLALSDLHLAIKEGHPEPVRFQLFWRMARCYRGSGQKAQATVALQVAQKMLEQQKEKMDKKKFEQSVRVLQEELDNLASSTDTTPVSKTKTTPILPELKGGEHSELPGAAKCVGVSSSPEAGRFIVATSAIKAGDAVLVQKPYAACLLPDMFGSHCHHCFQSLKAPVGCQKCSGVAFCSTACRDEACSSYHKYECAFMDVLIGSGMSILCHVALRMITQFSLQFVLSPSKLKGDKEPEKHFEAVYNLATHSHMRPVEDFFHRTLMAVFLLKVLQKSGYFPQPSSGFVLSAEEVRVGGLLLQGLQLLQFNAHEVYETRTVAPPGTRGRFRGARPFYIGVAIYPTAALFNHDCYPALARYFVGRTLVLRALRPLAAGETVPENYGPAFVKFPLAKRAKTLLSRYWFHCSCDACKGDWPQFEHMDDAFRMKCSLKGCSREVVVSENALEGSAARESKPRKKKNQSQNQPQTIKCRGCGTKVQLSSLLPEITACDTLYAEGLEALERGEAPAAASLFSAFVDRTAALGGRAPRKSLHLAQEALRTCLADEGNVVVVPQAGTQR